MTERRTATGATTEAPADGTVSASGAADGLVPTGVGRTELERAVLGAVAYGDVFDYPLTGGEVHRYLLRCRAPAGVVGATLAGGVPGLRRVNGYVTLAGREHLVEVRRRRMGIARTFWPQALGYGRRIAALPFVRMVAVTGALAADNVERSADIDYMVVTESGRLWSCRALVIAIVRLAARRGHVLCPNYFLAERALVLNERSLFTAHELVQMVPIAGLDVYWRLREVNGWTAEYLPNAAGLGRPISAEARRHWRPVRRATEALGRSRAGARVERWEMNRKLRKFGARSPGHAEAAFGTDWCRGFFDAHGGRILAAFAARIHRLATPIPGARAIGAGAGGPEGAR